MRERPRTAELTRIEPHAVHWHATSHVDPVSRCVDYFVARTKMVGFRRLVVHDGNIAVKLRAERIVGSDVSKAASLQHADVGTLSIRRSDHLVLNGRELNMSKGFLGGQPAALTRGPS